MSPGPAAAAGTPPPPCPAPPPHPPHTVIQGLWQEICLTIQKLGLIFNMSYETKNALHLHYFCFLASLGFTTKAQIRSWTV